MYEGEHIHSNVKIPSVQLLTVLQVNLRPQTPNFFKNPLIIIGGIFNFLNRDRFPLT